MEAAAQWDCEWPWSHHHVVQAIGTALFGVEWWLWWALSVSLKGDAEPSSVTALGKKLLKLLLLKFNRPGLPVVLLVVFKF